MPKSSAEKTKDWRQRLKDAGLHRVEIWVPNNPKSIAEAKKLDKRKEVKK